MSHYIASIQNYSLAEPEVYAIPEPLPVTAESIADDFQRYLQYHLGRFKSVEPVYTYQALSFALRDRLMADWRATWARNLQPGTRRAYYISLEFLIGRALGNHVLNMNLEAPVKEAMISYATTLETIESYEPDAGLGNGGLGRLAACFLDSCAALQLPVLGYGIRYEYGMFRQRIENQEQIEEPDHWLRDGHPWEVERPEYSQRVHFGGRSESFKDEKGRIHMRWVDTNDVLAIPYDLPVSGYQNNTVNTLRLWKATATDEFNLEEFNAGSYTDAVKAKNDAEHITMVLYPNDMTESGKELRLKQQYFLASASLQDAIRIWEKTHEGEVPRPHADSYCAFAAENVFQMNDTHPTIAVAELMRILMDEKGLNWEQSWDITSQCMAYTNHTLLPEALERWSVYLFERLLPRLLDIIYEINARFLRQVALRWPGDTQRLERMSIIEEGEYRQVRMAWLAIVGSFSVNGVAALHSQLLIDGLFSDFYELWPHKFNNKTNGVTPRRWMAHANPELSGLIGSVIGKGWIAELSQLEQLKPYADPQYTEFHHAWRQVKLYNKQRLAALVREECGVIFNPNALFDVQVKRIHEYKRQLLNILHVIHLYIRLKEGRLDNWVDRCFLFGGKAAPGYAMAKSIIKLINRVAIIVNNDSEVADRLKIAFLPNYCVSSMEVICPAADVSEQVSTAGKEASGTGNMKFMMNGALTVGTYDGANIEILDAVGSDNFFLFGLHENEVEKTREDYSPDTYLNDCPDLAAVINLIRSGYFNHCSPGEFDMILGALMSPYDPWMTLADFEGYRDIQNDIATAWQDPSHWTSMSIINTASSGFFSTDRTMHEYNNDIWKL